MIEINCDMGEASYESGVNQDKLFMPYIHACNIATGAHAGDLETMVKTMCFAKLNQVAIGIHPSYVDRDNFGRKVLDQSVDESITSIKRQIDIFKTIATRLEYDIDHCKAHGALYHELNRNKILREAYFNLLKEEFENITIYGLSDSDFINAAEDLGFSVKHEVFADRRYHSKKQLVSRAEHNAIISDELEFLDQLNLLVNESKVQTTAEGIQSLKVDTICIHSDSKNALSLAKIAFQHLNQMKN